MEGGYYSNALQAAVNNGRKGVVKLLLDRGANINACGQYYWKWWGDFLYNSNALYIASEHGNKQIVDLLLDKGADINKQSGKYGSALVAASACGHKQVVELLLEKGADVNALGRQPVCTEDFDVYDEISALHAASEHGHKQVVELLLEKGADDVARYGQIDNGLQVAFQ